MQNIWKKLNSLKNGIFPRPSTSTEAEINRLENELQLAHQVIGEAIRYYQAEQAFIQADAATADFSQLSEQVHEARTKLGESIELWQQRTSDQHNPTSRNKLDQRRKLARYG